MSLQDKLERAERCKQLASDVRLAADRLNDAIALCAQAGLTVEVEVKPTADSSRELIRNIVQVTPYWVEMF